MMLNEKPPRHEDTFPYPPTLLRQLALLALASVTLLTLLWSFWLWRASDREAEADERQHIAEELARFVSLFEHAWPERKVFLALEVQNHVSHETALALVVVDGAGQILATHDPTHIGQRLEAALPDLAPRYRLFAARNHAYLQWREGNTLWGAARWSIVPGGDAHGPDGVILLGYDLAPVKAKLRRELAWALLGLYVIFLTTLLFLAGWVWRYHLVPLRQTSLMASRRASAMQWRAAARTAPTAELALFAQHAAQAQEQLEAQERELQLLATAIEASPASVVITDPVPQILWVNPAFERVTGYTLAEVHGKNPSILKSGQTPLATYEALWAKLAQGEVWSGEFINKRKDGSCYHEWAIIAPVRDATGTTTHYVAVKFDISREKLLAAQLAFATHHDATTGLLNRQALVAALDQRLSHPTNTYALFLCDVARFGYYNQRFGAAFGDRLLALLGQRLLAQAGGDEIAARIGSDEFALVAPVPCPERSQNPSQTFCPQATAEAQRRLDQLLAALQEPLSIPDPEPGWPNEVSLSFIVGAIPYTAGFTRGSHLLAAAAIALARAKKEEKPVFWFSEEEAAQLDRAGQILDALRAALSGDPEQQGLLLCWQPQLLHGQLVGCEALVRFHHPTLGPISPGEFIPLAENHGLIESLGSWVLASACHQGAAWAREFGYGGTLSVNVSPQQLRQPEAFAQQVAAAVTASGWPGERLVLEITENLLLTDTERAIDLMNEVHNRWGVCWSIDDFGTGYSSLAYLERLPVHELKIDQQFIRQLGSTPQSIRLVQAIVQIADTYGLRVVAEGVEDAACVAALTPFSTLIHQGWFYSRPLPANEFAATWLGRGATNR